MPFSDSALYEMMSNDTVVECIVKSELLTVCMYLWRKSNLWHRGSPGYYLQSEVQSKRLACSATKVNVTCAVVLQLCVGKKPKSDETIP